MFHWTYILKKCRKIRCFLGSKSEQYCATFPANIKHEHCCEHCRILEEIAESHHFIDIFILRNNILLIISLFLLNVTLRISK